MFRWIAQGLSTSGVVVLWALSTSSLACNGSVTGRPEGDAFRPGDLGYGDARDDGGTGNGDAGDGRGDAGDGRGDAGDGRGDAGDGRGDAGDGGDGAACVETGVNETRPTPESSGPAGRPVTPCIAMPLGFGGYGTWTHIREYVLDNPAWSGAAARPIRIFEPYVPGCYCCDVEPKPTIFFAHPFGGNSPERSRLVFEHLVTRGFIVVYVPYPTASTSICDRYDILWSGFSEAVSARGNDLRMNLDRVGVVGHSFGGGAAPWLARMAVQNGWGNHGALLVSMAPWYSYRMDDGADWAAISSTMSLLVIVFEQDDTNDHQMAVDLYDSFAGPKSYLTLRSDDSHPACTTLVADHVVPRTSESTPGDSFDGLDTWGIWRRVDALAACTLGSDPSGCELALATGGTADPGDMGGWLSDGLPVTRAVATTTPLADYGYSYLFPHGSEPTCN